MILFTRRTVEALRRDLHSEESTEMTGLNVGDLLRLKEE